MYADLKVFKTKKEEVVDYLASLGNAHRDLWIRRLKKGMKPELEAQFADRIAAYAALPKELPNRITFSRQLPYPIDPYEKINP